MQLSSLRSFRVSFFALELISFFILLDYLSKISTRTNISLELSGFKHLPGSLLAQDTLSPQTYPAQDTEWEPPPSFDSQLSQFHREDNFTQVQLQYPWNRPLVYLHSTRPSYKNESERALYLYSQGLRLGGIDGFPRNFTVVGCLVGATVYPISFTSGEQLYICKVRHRITDGSFLSVVVQSDEHVQNALTLEPIQINHGMNVTLKPGDLTQIPDHYHITPEVKSISKGKKLYYVRSIVTFQSNLELVPVHQRKEKVRYEICGCTQNKLYPQLTAPWVDYHRQIGMDFIFIIDNNATKDLQKAFEHRSDVEVYFWPYAKSKVQIWSYIFQLALTKCEWLFFFDTEEYISFGVGTNMEDGKRNPLKVYTNKLRKSGKIAVKIYHTLVEGLWQLEIPKSTPSQVSEHEFPYQYGEGKMMIRTDYPWTRANIYRHYNMHNQVPSTLEGLVETHREITGRPIEIDGLPLLVRFKIRLWKEWSVKAENERDSLLLTYQDKTGGKSMNEFINEKNDTLKYKYFKSIWESVTKTANMEFQTLVKTESGKRCTAVIKTSNKTVVREMCEDIEEETDDMYV